jgi:hypothetical protein
LRRGLGSHRNCFQQQTNDDSRLESLEKGNGIAQLVNLRRISQTCCYNYRDANRLCLTVTLSDPLPLFFFTCVTGNMTSNIMSTSSTSGPTSPPLPRDMPALSESFRSSSPTHPIQIKHPIPNHAHLHIHTIRSTMTPPNSSSLNDESGVYDDDVSHPSSISAQILTPFLNGPVPSIFTTTSPHQNSTVSTNGLSRGASARTNVLGSSSRSSSARGNRRRRSNEDNSLVAEYMELIGDGTVDAEKLEEIRRLAGERGVPSQLRRVKYP